MKKLNSTGKALLFCIAFFSLILSSCKKDEVVDTPTVSVSLTAEQQIEKALVAFAANLAANPATTADLSARIKTYMLENREFFYGSTVTLLNSAGVATYSPYWYRSGDSLLELNLAADTAYHINDQPWLRQPIDIGSAIWTTPYFDAGGGNVWMKTKSVPVIVNGKIIAVATTDLAILKSEQKIELALGAFVSNLEASPANTTDLSARIKAYLEGNPDLFYGSTVTLLNSAGVAYYSPYWYRSGNSMLLTDLAADTAYHINDQEWLRQPIDSGVAIWTNPYFDLGGGNIWMKTRSVPVFVNGQIVAVATTDLAL